MPFVVFPSTRVGSPICPGVDSLAVFLIVKVLAFILSAILPLVNTHSVLFVLMPFPLISAPISPDTCTSPLHSPIDPLSFIESPIRKIVFALSVPLAFIKISLVSVSIRVRLSPVAMLKVIIPFTLIYRFGLSVNICSMTMGLVLLPVTLVSISSDMDKFPLPLCLSIGPVSCILGSVGPLLYPVAVSVVMQPLAVVLYSIIEFDHLPFHGLFQVACIGPGTQIFSSFVVQCGLLFVQMEFLFLTADETPCGFVIALPIHGRPYFFGGREFAFFQQPEFVVGVGEGLVACCALAAHRPMNVQIKLYWRIASFLPNSTIDQIILALPNMISPSMGHPGPLRISQTRRLCVRC